MKKHTLAIFKETTIRIPRSCMQDIYTDVLEKKCDLNLIFTDGKKLQYLNKNFRGKDYTPNILTFSHTDMPAEIYINAPMAQKEAKKVGVPLWEHLVYLYIHGIVHLLGYAHGSAMEKMEDDYATKYIYNR